MRLGIVCDFEVVVVMTKKGMFSLLDGDVSFVGFGLKIMDEDALAGDDDEHVFEYADFADFEVAFEIVDVSLVQEIWVDVWVP